MSKLRPVGRDLAWHNRRVIAERMKWPDGALEVCEQFEREHPNWYPNWWATPEPGFYALPWTGAGWMERPRYGADAEQLAEAVAKWVPKDQRH